MAYDEALAADIRMVLSGESGVSEKKMFGGLGFMINGNMAVAANANGGMMVRVSPELASTLLEPPNVDLFDMGGRRMAGWLKVLDPGDQLSDWVATGVAYARSLSAK